MPLIADPSFRAPFRAYSWRCFGGGLCISFLLAACGSDEALPERGSVRTDSGASSLEAGASPGEPTPVAPPEGGVGAEPEDAGAAPTEPPLDAGPLTDAAWAPPASGSDSGASAADAAQPVDAPDSGRSDPPDGGATLDAALALDASVSEASVHPVVVGVRGVVVVSSRLTIDADRRSSIVGVGNDVLATLDPEVDTAQPLARPGWAGGYLGPRTIGVNSMGAGIADAGVGQPADIDRVDYYRVDLRSGDAVTLFIHPDPRAPDDVADLDLYLLDDIRNDFTSDGWWIEDSISAGPTEQLIAPRSQEYWIAVHRPDDESSVNSPHASARYTLLVNVPLSTSVQQQVSAGKLSSSLAPVPGKAVVGPPDRGSSAEYEVVELADVEAGSPRSTLREIKRLRRLGQRAEPLLRLQPQGLPSDPLFSRQWYVHPVELLRGWEESEKGDAALGEGVVVAVVDTGVAMNHPDFVNEDGSSQLLSDGYDVISDPQVADDGDGRDADPNDPGDGVGPGGGTFHGTHCAGNIAAATNNGIGIVGVAPRARVRPVRALGRGGGSLEDVVEGIRYAAGLPNETGQLPEAPSDIINLSIAGPGRSELMEQAIADARAQGSIVIAAAGNFQSPAENFTPGGEPGAVTVSAVDALSELAWYSNYGTTDGVIDLAGVGGDASADVTLDGFPDAVFSTLFKNGGTSLYGDIEGTSMAAAQVAGVAALMKAIWPEMGPAEFEQLLPQIVVDIGAPGVDGQFGHGLVNVPLAVALAQQAALGEFELGPVLRLSRRGFDFSTEFSELPLAIQDAADAGLIIEEVVGEEPWVRLVPGVVGENTVEIDRTMLSPGEHLARVTVVTNGGSADLSIAVEIPQVVEPGDVGPVFVALLDADSNAVADLTLTDAGLDYAFSFDPPAPGRYRLVAGTDWDDLGALGQAGDAFGARPFREPTFCVAQDGTVGWCGAGQVGVSEPVASWPVPLKLLQMTAADALAFE